MVLVSWGLTPLQNGIFTNGVIAVPSVTSLRDTNSFLPLNEQSAQLGMNILNTAYSLLWLGQDMPPFTTPEYTLAPFEASQTGQCRKFKPDAFFRNRFVRHRFDMQTSVTGADNEDSWSDFRRWARLRGPRLTTHL